MAMPLPGTRTMRNRFLGNAERARLRGVVNILPGFMQRLFPPSDLRRQIRMHPENRDTIDPEWRIRAGRPAPTPEQIADRRAFILYERSLADLESRQWAAALNNNLTESPRDTYIKARTEFAAKMYDQLVENPEITNDIYTNLHDRVYSQHVNHLEAPVARRALLTLHGFFNVLPPLPQGWNGGHQAREITNRIIPITPEQAAVIGVEPNAAPEIPAVNAGPFGNFNNNFLQPEMGVQGALVFNYNDLPDLGAVGVDGDDPITFEPYVNGEELVVITQNGFSHKFKRQAIMTWLTQQATNPATGLPVQLAQLSRAVADTAGDPVNAIGGRRRKRKTKKAARKLRRRHSRRQYRRN